MTQRHRLDQLHALIDQLERLPASPDRDWMMAEVRARAVDVETGARPGPIRPRDHDEATPPREPTSPKLEKRHGNKERRAARSRRGEAGRATKIHEAKSQRPPAPSRAGAMDAAPSDAAVPTSVPASGPTDRAGDDVRIDLLAHGGVLCLGDLPAEAPATDAGYLISPPWARGLRG
jgi:hypothetical protein